MAFLTVLSWLTDYDLAPDELAIITDRVRETDSEANQWFDYEFTGKQRIEFSLAVDPGTSVVHARVQALPEQAAKVEMAIAIFAHFHIRQTA